MHTRPGQQIRICSKIKVQQITVYMHKNNARQLVCDIVVRSAHAPTAVMWTSGEVESYDSIVHVSPIYEWEKEKYQLFIKRYSKRSIIDSSLYRRHFAKATL